MRGAAALVSLAAVLLACGGSSSPVDASGGAGGEGGAGGQGGGQGGSGAQGGGELPFVCPADADAVFDGLVADFTAHLEAHGVPGGAVGLVCGGEVHRVAGVGVTRVANGAPVTPDTRFQWASSTKMFTAVAAAVLAEEGVVDFDAPVSGVVPSLQQPGLTLHHLLSHTAAFPTQWEVFANPPDLGPTVEANAHLPLWASPGEVHVYSNTGFSVAGYVLEVAAGQPFGALVEQRVLEPAGLDATFDIDVVLAGEVAWGHTDGGAEVHPSGAYLHTGAYGPMGGAWGSIRDLAGWARAHSLAAHGGPLASAMLAVREPQTQTDIPATSYGYGHFVSHREPQHVDHGGAALGYLADFVVLPERGIGLALLLNADHDLPFELMTNTIEALAPTESVAPVTFGSHADFVGTYHDPHVFGTIEVTSDGTDLMVHLVDEGPPVVAQPFYGDVFNVPGPGAPLRPIHFWRPGYQGAATHMASRFGIAARVP